MTDKPENPQAFPIPADDKAGWHSTEGMTLRDYFAGKALAGFFASALRPIQDRDEDLAHDAEFVYRVADAMLKARME